MGYVVFHEETGAILDPKKKKKTKRAEAFLMIDLVNADTLAKMKELHGADHRILWLILSKLTYDNTALISQSYIADALAMPRSQVSVSIKKLMACNIIKRFNEAGNSGFIVNKIIADRGVTK